MTNVTFSYIEVCFDISCYDKFTRYIRYLRIHLIDFYAAYTPQALYTFYDKEDKRQLFRAVFHIDIEM